MQHVLLLICIGLGLLVARITNVGTLQGAAYTTLTGALLAVGLYASTSGIVLKEARQHVRIIMSAVTIGVVLKAAIIGGGLALIFQDPFFILLGVAIAQIDPLSVAGLIGKERLSAKAKTILASWASFDDPITVILALYTPLLVARLAGNDYQSFAVLPNSGNSVAAYIAIMGLNILFAASLFGVYWLLRRYASGWRIATAIRRTIAGYLLLTAALVVSVVNFFMLGIALVGLFLRPPGITILADRAIKAALRIAAFLLGMLLVKGVDVRAGVALGIAAYGAQIIAGWLLTRGLPRRDRWHISLAQQNGITAIILALLIEPVHPGAVAIIAPAIIIINGLHWLANRQLDRYYKPAPSK